jgi:hypothetical protein
VTDDDKYGIWMKTEPIGTPWFTVWLVLGVELLAMVLVWGWVVWG